MSYPAANSRFRVGQRVRFTKEAIRHHIPTRYRGKVTMTGKVTRLDRNPFVIWVLLDGYKRASSYHVDFWAPVAEGRTDG